MSNHHEAFVAQLAVPHRASGAYRGLISCGLDALPAVRAGLRHESADVRHRCCQFLDHFLTPEVVGDLISMLDDADHRVRSSALHALACHRCKEGSCRPGEAQVLPRAIAVLANDRSPHVRAMAIEVGGRWVHTNLAAEAALVKAMESDPNSTVRKKAGWYGPGGTTYRRTTSKIRVARGTTRKAAPSP